MKLCLLFISCLFFLSGCASTGYQPNYIISHEEDLSGGEN